MGRDTTPISLASVHIAQASAMFARAFQHDPLLAHLIPDEATRRIAAPHVYRCVIQYGRLYGQVETTSAAVEGAAVWLPPDAAYTTLWKMFRAGLFALPFHVGVRFVRRALAYFEHVDRLRHQHTRFPHWYLQLLGVDPPQQRRGHALALLAPTLARLDDEQLPCCLDTTNGDNVAIYERFGFRIAAESRFPKTDISVWLMTRGR
jgi:ribosomal protein S18 acetylase RimI-like enzyme